MLSGNKYTSRSSLGSAIYQCLQQIPKEDYLSAFHDWVKKVTKMCFSKGGILWRFVIKICLIKCIAEVIRTQWQNFCRTLIFSFKIKCQTKNLSEWCWKDSRCCHSWFWPSLLYDVACQYCIDWRYWKLPWTRILMLLSIGQGKTAVICCLIDKKM